MPAARSIDGERIARIEEALVQLQSYERDRWHKLDNDLTPVVNLPVQFARDMAKLEVRLDAKIDGRLAAIEGRLTSIEAQKQQFTGARLFGAWIVGIVVSVLAGMGIGHHP